MRHSTVGRPRRLTDSQVAEVLKWHDALLDWKSKRRTLETIQQIAARLGVSRSSISSAIQRRGQFKRASPPDRDVGIAEPTKAAPKPAKRD
jgi:hypothetical protein